MSWGITAVVGGGLIGGYLASEGAQDAADIQAQGIREGQEAEERMFERALELQEPYREAGYRAIEGLENLATPRGRAVSLQEYYSSPEYDAMRQESEEAILRSQSAIGGLRSGSSYEALDAIAPELGQNYLANQYNQLTGLANLGMGAASQGAQGAQYLGSQTSRALSSQARAQSDARLARGNLYADIAGTLGGIGYTYLTGGRGF